MNWLHSILEWWHATREAIESGMANPKVATVAATYSTSSGLLLLLDQTPKVIGILAALGGLIGMAIVARFNWLRGENERLRGELLRKKLQGIDVSIDEDE
jgi:hypothetical protein